MIIFYPEHRRFLHVLIKHEVEFILIGGYAVNYHGYNRPTGDMDIWLKPDNNNKLKLIAALRSENFSDDGIKQVESLDFLKPACFYFGRIPLRIDFLTKISGVQYDEADKQKKLMKVDDFHIPVLHLHHLILSKISNTRTKDKQDVEELQKIIKLKKDK